MISRRGELSFEGIMGVAFIAIVIVTCMAIYQFHTTQNPEKANSRDIITSYNYILETLGTDVKFADQMKFDPTGVDLMEKGSLLASYKFLNGNLYRTDADGKDSILLSKLERADFRAHEDLKRLLMVTLLPEDRMQIPFFTSFALRGTEKP